MYGYLRLIDKSMPSLAFKHYRSLYCTLCHALWYFYGLRPRFLLTYDMTFLAVVLDLKSHVDLNSRFKCYTKTDINVQDEEWKRIAAMSILLAAGKLADDVADDNDIRAKIALHIFNKAAQKAKEDYPEVAEVFQIGLAEMADMEKHNADVFALSHKMGDITEKALQLTYSCPSEEVIVMRHVTEWVYFIDALDDLENDVKDGNYNPFKVYASTKKMLINNEYDYLERFVNEQMNRIRPILSSFSEATDRNCIILSILTHTLPTVTSRVLKGEKPFAKHSPLVKKIERKGGYRLA